MRRLELWGGPECTINRVGDTYHDQLRASGHDKRLSDLDLFADLGMAAIRYPILWEKTAPDAPGIYDWNWADTRLDRLRALRIRPIIGLVHHGSGPHYTDLLADNFATGLADYARAVAERYPWVTDWTPVNEPVTTARFSALYGIWYPHHHDEQSFWLALLNQIDGTRFAMAEVRKVNPGARLIQTDDLGRTYATAVVRDQAAFNNVRRWMGWDLLFGRVVPGHPMWQRLCGYGFERRLGAIADDPCPPDVVGVNHYLTSDRFLDHRIKRYPVDIRSDHPACHYADTEAVRVLEPPPPGLGGALVEAWERYGAPIAVTEVHNGCTREEQMRWMAEAWETAQDLREDGIEICAVTSWALLGSSGWNTLLTGAGAYEAGVFDVGSGTPKPTAMVNLLKALSQSGTHHPVVDADGWWRRGIRLRHPVVPRPAPIRDQCLAFRQRATTQPVLVVHLEAAWAEAFAADCLLRGLACTIIDWEVADAEALDDLLAKHQPWAVIGRDGALLAHRCAERGLPLIAPPPGELDGSSRGAVRDLLDALIDGDPVSPCAKPLGLKRLVAA